MEGSSPNPLGCERSWKMNTEISCFLIPYTRCAPGVWPRYARRPPSSENSEFLSSGKSNVKGIFPWNHGFTVCRSEESTSTGEELARVAMCRSANSLYTRSWLALWRLNDVYNVPAATTKTAAATAANCHLQPNPKRGFADTA